MAIELVPLGTLTVQMGDTVTLPQSPSLTRIVVEFPDVRWEGERLRARRRGATAGDWLTVGPEGTATIDIRFVLETDDGALLYVQTGGRTDAATFSQGGALYLAPRFETSDPRYAWLNKVQAVAKGALGAGGVVTFEVYELR